MKGTPHAAKQRRLPAQVVATGSGAYSWREGASRLWEDPSWLVRTVDPNLRKDGHTITVRFDSPIAPGLTLAHPASRLDVRTKRELLASALTAGFGHGPLGATAAGALARCFDWLVRWRIDRGVASLAGLDAMDHDDFVGRLRSGTVLDLADMEARLDAVAAAIARGDIPSPVARPGSGVAHMGVLAARLGVTPGSLWGSPWFPGLLECRLQLLFPSGARGGLDVAAAEAEVPSASSMAGYLDVWRCLAAATRAGVLPHDPLRFDPSDRGPAARIAERLGAPGGRTPTIEPPAFFALLLAAARFILEEGPALVASLNARLSSAGAPQPEPADGGMPPHVAVRHAMAACAILVGGLAGRRIGETVSVRAGCVLEPQPGVHEIVIPIEKSSGRSERVAAPALVAAALRILEDLTATSRAATGDPWLFRLVLPATGRVVDFDPSVDLPAFAAHVGWDAGPGGEALASHQLRRGFAIWCYHGYVLGCLEAVGRQLRHGGPESTSIYVTGADPGGTIRLRDRLSAGFSASLAAMPEADRIHLRGVLRRLAAAKAAGVPIDSARCEEASLALLQAWPDEAAAPRCPSSPAASFREMKARAAATIRIGSRTRRPGDSPDAPLADMVRAHAASLFGEARP